MSFDPNTRLRRARGSGSLLLWLFCAACAQSDAREHPTWPLGDLAGVWTAEFTPANSPGSSAAMATGQIALIDSPWLRRTYGITDASVREGLYDVDFAPLGFEARPERSVPLASGDFTRADSVEIRLNPRVSNGSIVLSGVWRGDVIEGTWYRATHGGARGLFRLRLRSTS